MCRIAGRIMAFALLLMTPPLSLGHMKLKSLNKHNFDEIYTMSNDLVVYFFVPWCQLCIDMQDDWVSLQNETTHTFEVNCHEPDGQVLCSRYMVQDFPSVMHGTLGHLELYQGPRSLEALRQLYHRAIAQETCTPFRLDRCSDSDYIKILQYLAAPRESLELAVAQERKDYLENGSPYDKLMCIVKDFRAFRARRRERW